MNKTILAQLLNSKIIMNKQVFIQSLLEFQNSIQFDFDSWVLFRAKDFGVLPFIAPHEIIAPIMVDLPWWGAIGYLTNH